MKELPANLAGLAIRWDEWAGSSRIVIPLAGRPGSPTGSGVATSPITDKAVVQSLKEETGGSATDQRQDMVNLREDEIAKQEKAVEQEKARIAAEQQALAEQQKKLEEEQKKLEQAGAGQQASVTETEAAKAEQERKQQELARQQEELAQQQAKLEEQKKANEQQEAAVAAQKQEVADERQSIAEDQKKEIAAQVAAQEKPPTGTVLFELIDPNLPMARLILLDVNTGNRIKRSDINTMRANTAFDAGDYFIAVAGQSTAAGGTVRLVAVSKSSFAVQAQSSEEVFADARIVKIGSFIYTIVKKDGKWVLGKFDAQKLTLLAFSQQVSPWTAIMELNGLIVVQGPGGSFYLLKPDNLSLDREIK